MFCTSVNQSDTCCDVVIILFEKLVVSSSLCVLSMRPHCRLSCRSRPMIDLSRSVPLSEPQSVLFVPLRFDEIMCWSVSAAAAQLFFVACLLHGR